MGFVPLDKIFNRLNTWTTLKKWVIEHLTRFAHEKRGTPAAIFRGKFGAILAMKQLDDLLVIPVLRQIADNETDGRLQRRAEDTIVYLRESAKKPKEIKDIRSELDDVITENKSLRERMDMIEKKRQLKLERKKDKEMNGSFDSQSIIFEYS